MAKQTTIKEPSITPTFKPSVKDQRFCLEGKDLTTKFKGVRRFYFDKYEEAKERAAIWKRNGGQGIRLIIEEGRPGIVWEEVNSETI